MSMGVTGAGMVPGWQAAAPAPPEGQTRQPVNPAARGIEGGS
jgi:hypothetical protein